MYIHIVFMHSNILKTINENELTEISLVLRLLVLNYILGYLSLITALILINYNCFQCLHTI